MSVVYSLICWGGSSGKSVTVSSSTDYVTLTRHGLRDGKGVQFTSGTLPSVAGTALALNTTYYVKVISTSTFELYYDSGLTSKIDFTSNGSSLVLKGAYYQGLTDTSRWGSNIFDGMASCNTTRASAASSSNSEVWEIGEDFEDDLNTSNLIIQPACPDVTVKTINGAGHNGTYGAGYTLKSNWASSANGVLNTGCPGSVEGFTVKNGVAGSGLNITYPSASADKMIVIGTPASGYGIRAYSSLVKVTNCVVTGFAWGINHANANLGMVIANNILTGNSIGYYTPASSGVYGYCWNNISIGNTTNWSTQPTGLEGAGGNAGVSGNSPWKTGSFSQITMATTDFANYAGNDFRPASSSSPQVDAAIEYYGILSYDVAGDERPNYNNGGSEAYDVGAFEYDHGYGPHPATAPLVLQNVVSGSTWRVEDTADNSLISSGTASGGDISVTVPYYGSSRTLRVRVRKGTAQPKYQPYETQVVVGASGGSAYVSQVPDTIAA